MADCIFCKLVAGEIPSYKIWEDSEFAAILDVFPNTEGMTLIITKGHYDSYAFDMPDDIYQKLMLASKKVARGLEKALKVKRVAMVMEGMGVNHVHIKLYPLYGLDEKFKETWAKKEVYFEKYQGYISTQLGPKANPEDLKQLAQRIREVLK